MQPNESGVLGFGLGFVFLIGLVWVLWVLPYGKEEGWIGIGNGTMEWRFINKR